jgi:Protein of unknown function (DUF1549)/Protein of unknown function (DUF1553)/Planctomycete cytochrome C
MLALLCLAHLSVQAEWGPSLAAAEKPSPEAVKFFEERVRPVLLQRCVECHGAKKQKSGLRVDSLIALQRGGDHGPALNLDRPDDSLLLRVIGPGQPFAMPPKDKLPPRERGDLQAWVRMGAPWPGAVVEARPNPEPGKPLFTELERSFWAFRKPTEPALPQVRNKAWVQSPIDAFILAGLEARGLQPAPPADKRTLIRRVTFDLIGLPPTPEEIDSFLKDDKSDAFARLVDRLLASPRYGERWGRHWLDVARYADSNGMDENLAYGNAWRYRDYIIDAFNKDKPYDQLVVEQLAGDLLSPSPDPRVNAERLIATGFLCLGPKMLAEDDPVKMQMDVIDEQIDTIGRTFLGLTLGCARCHDHKFDPIPTADYYGLAGIFKSTRTMENFSVVARWQERPIASAEDLARAKVHQDRVTEARTRLTTRLDAILRAVVADLRQKQEAYAEASADLWRQAEVRRQRKPLMNDPQTATKPGVLRIEAENFDRGNVLKDFDNYGAKIGVILNKGALPNVAEYDVKLERAGVYALEIRHAAAEARPVRVSVNGQLVVAEAAGQTTGTWFPDTQAWHVVTVVSLKAGVNTLRLERNGPFPHIDCLALIPCVDTPGAPALKIKTAEQWASEKQLRIEALRAIVSHAERNPKTAPALDMILKDPRGPFAAAERAESFASPAETAELKTLREQLATLEKAAPTVPQAMAVSEGTFGNVRIHLRGNHLTLGEDAPRQFPRILAGVRQTPIDRARSGRLEFARWLVQPDHPLTARVMANRVWRWHFGSGLVRSTDNFGRLGEKPDNPALLDFLAVSFVQNGWSIKSLHRLIVLSSAYQMSTARADKAVAIDPENRLLSRRERRRLEVEALRDSLLAASGQLDLTMAGSLLITPNRAYVASTFSVNPTNYKTSRRSVYLPVVRSALYEVFQAFDFVEPSVASGDRATTTVAPQALFMMNSDVLHQSARQLAALLTGDEADRVRTAYLRLYGRPATEREVERALAFVRRVEETMTTEKVPPGERRTKAWQSLYRALLAANEFVYVE